MNNRGYHSRRFGSVLAFVLSFVLSPSSSKTFSTLIAFSILFSNGPERHDRNFADLNMLLNL
jgi:hypothetical protein